MEQRSFYVMEDEEGGRLDVFLSEQFEDISRSYIQKLVKDGLVSVNGKLEKAKYIVRENDTVEVNLPDRSEPKPQPEDIRLEIVYEDDQVIVVNKPQGMVVHPAPGNSEGTLVNALLHHCDARLSTLNGVTRPGIVHRIDKDTSGLLVAAKTDRAHEELASQFKVHSIERTYEMVCIGNVKEERFTVDMPIGRNPSNRLKMAVVNDGKNAITHFEVIKRYEGYTHMRAKLETGRTHQIRVHISHMHHPILGDPIYGPKKSPFKLCGQTLHARTLGFLHPVTGEYMEFTSELPDYFTKILKALEK
ncbi:putative RNA pseudouridine synthase YlyB [Peptoclostridium acidaminophilum DSM 3953]|uniref:Pseudouridine synthase n=1 Tax=Peptoclostridium acidaminophilum DSM 3953 TaxID=1286171 RepID=W8T4T9_PEPAC|nr:RluA family pseudouridine synthase [Peptoclostridium acidaminophilum]AHM56779.1 putative RNA pseudouridine synthase YlyB [Peptoclostridium acidaminophilum DSM 3953]